MYGQLILTIQGTPFGFRACGPDRQRVVYLKNGQAGAVKLHANGEALWASEVVELYVSSVPDGVELKIVVHGAKRQAAQSTVKAA
jgi:hypothetical protein